VATATEVHDHLRLLFARIGHTFCDSCGSEVARDTAESVTERLLGLPPGTRLLLGFPVWAGGMPPADVFERLRKRGFSRLLRGQEVVSLEEGEAKGAVPDPLVVLVDRLEARGEARSRLTDSVETALAEGGGQAEVQVVGGPLLSFSESFSCARCARSFPEPQPSLFSFNNPVGACPTCHGFGNLIQVDLDLVIPDKEKSLAGGAVEPWNKPHYRSLLADLKRFARRRGISTETPWSRLNEAHRRLVLEGDEEFPGILGFFRWLEAKKYKVQVRVFLSRYRGYQECPTCRGSRLRKEALCVKIGGRSLDEVSVLSVREARAFLGSLDLDKGERRVAAKVLSEINRRLGFLGDVGLDYLTLNRPSGTLAGGEAQRIALATALGTGLVGTLYVLDEPSVGLHPRDTDRLIRILGALRDQGNTVLVVEHDPAIMRGAGSCSRAASPNSWRTAAASPESTCGASCGSGCRPADGGATASASSCGGRAPTTSRASTCGYPWAHSPA
jgi:excinuclease ABC subunit A